MLDIFVMFQKTEVVLFQYISYFVFYVGVIILFVLNFFADAAPKFSEYPVYEVNLVILLQKLLMLFIVSI